MNQTDHVPDVSGPSSDPGHESASRLSPAIIRLRAVVAAARFHGLELDIRDFAADPEEESPSPATLVRWLEEQGAVAKGMRIKWRYLVKMTNSPPIVLMFRDGSAAIMVGADPGKGVVWLRDPLKDEAAAPCRSMSCV